MSLPTNIDAPLTQNHIETAQKAIEAAAASLQTLEGGYPQIVATNRLSETVTVIHAYLQKLYENADWYNLYQGLLDVTTARTIQSKELPIRKLFTACLMCPRSQQTEHYKNMVQLLRTNPANGDAYLALAVLKLQDHPDDAQALVQLAALCPLHHPDVLRLLRDKIAWYKKLNEFSFLENARAIKDLLPLPRAKIELAEHYDEYIKFAEKLTPTPLSEVSSMVQTCFTPKYKPLIEFCATGDDPIVDCDSILAQMPNQAFSKVLEHLDFSTIRSLLQVSGSIHRRTHESSAFAYHDTRIFGAPLFVGRPDSSNLRKITFSVFHVALHLQHLDWNDIRSFDTVIDAYCTQTAIGNSEWPVNDHISISMRYFALFLHMILQNSGEAEGHLVQYIVSRTNLHLHLARLTRMSGDRSLEVAYCLNAILASKAKDAQLWVAELESISYTHVLETMEYGSFERIAFSSKSIINYGHYVNRLQTVYYNGLQLDAAMQLQEMRACASGVKSALAGIWHLLWYPHREWPGQHVQPNYASFRILPSKVKVNTGLESEEGENDELEEEAAQVPDGAISSFNGYGKMVTIDHELKDCEIIGSINPPLPTDGPSPVTIELSIDGLGISLSGVSISIGYGGGYRFADMDPSSREALGGCFLLWKSSLEPTDEQWQAELAEVSLHHESRTKGAEHLRRERLSDSAAELELRTQLDRDAVIGTNINFGVPISETQYSNLVALEDVMDAYALQPLTDVPHLLSRGFYESMQSYNLRCHLHEVLYGKVLSDMQNTNPIHVTSTTARDLIQLMTRLEVVLTTIAVDLARPESERSVEPLKQRIADYKVVYGYLGISTFSNIATEIGNIRSIFETAMADRDNAAPLPPTLCSAAHSLKVILYQFPSCRNATSRQEYNTAARRLLLWEMDALSEAPLVPFPEGPSTLAQRLSWYELNESRFSRAHRIQRKWLGYHHAVDGALDDWFPPLNLVLLCQSLSSGIERYSEIAGLFEEEYYDEDWGAEDDDEVAPPVVFNAPKSRKAKKGSSLINATTISLLSLGAIAIGLGTFAVMRILNRKD